MNKKFDAIKPWASYASWKQTSLGGRSRECSNLSFRTKIKRVHNRKRSEKTIRTKDLSNEFLNACGRTKNSRHPSIPFGIKRVIKSNPKKYDEKIKEIEKERLQIEEDK